MKRQQYLQHRLQTLSALRDAVGAMRSLSAHHFRRARHALPAARQYRAEMNTVIAEIGIRQPRHIGIPPGLLVIASDLGLCGDYNSRLSQLAVAEAHSQAVQRVYSVGHRVRAALAKSALVPVRTYDAPASLEGLSHLLLGLAQDVLEDYSALRIGSLHVVSAGFEGVGHFTPLSVQVLPIEAVEGAKPLRRSPYIDSKYLTAVAVREYLYITLFEVLLDALAAEHGMRLMAAESALEWLDNTATITSRRLASARGEAATQELLDIVTGGRKRFPEKQVHYD
ncbi:MAG: F0F1 ATP synthase subunit gamma [Candidatus Competibacteraceae bacterium]|nr:F0F1 ATP synthase subunit gamma [Candidatus Competibacteraceae bacterium]